MPIDFFYNSDRLPNNLFLNVEWQNVCEMCAMNGKNILVNNCGFA